MKNPIQNLAPCAAFDADLKAHLDGELSLWRRLQVRRHLNQCPQCREEIQLMQSLKEELKTQESAPLDADLRAKILDNAPQNAPAPLPNRRRAVRKLGLALAGVSLLAVGFQASQQSEMVSDSTPALEKAMSANGAKNEADADEKEVKALPPSAPPSARAAGAASDAASADSRSNFTFKNESERSFTRNQVDAMSATKLRDSGTTRRAPTLGQRGDSIERKLEGSNYGFIDGQVKWLSSTSGSKDGASYAPSQRAVHREGSVTVAVANAETASESVADIIKNVGGFIATNSLSTGSDGRRSATLDVRAPVDQFETLVAKIGGLGTVRAKSINGEDITQRITQANARRATLSRELSIDQTRLREKEAKAKKSDAGLIYQLRAEVRDSRLRAAQSRAEWEYLRKYAALSTLYVVLQDKTKPVEAAGWSSSLGPTGTQAWNTFSTTMKLPLQLLIWILAYAPLWVPALIIWKKWGRKWVNA